MAADLTDLLERRVKTLVRGLDSFIETSANDLRRAAGLLADAGTVFTCGNGGSAAQAMHVEAELLGRYTHDRPPRAAMALQASAASTSCIVNDFGPDHAFSRPLQALGRPGDVLLALSTSGTSPNVLAALETGRKAGLGTVLLSGPGAATDLADVVLRFPGERADVIQDGHQLLIHALMDALDPPP